MKLSNLLLPIIVIVAYYSTYNTLDRSINSSININNFVEIPAKLNNIYVKISKVKAMLVNDKVDHYILDFQHNHSTGGNN